MQKKADRKLNAEENKTTKENEPKQANKKVLLDIISYFNKSISLLNVQTTPRFYVTSTSSSNV